MAHDCDECSMCLCVCRCRCRCCRVCCACDDVNLWKLAHFLFHSTMNEIVRFWTIFCLSVPFLYALSRVVMCTPFITTYTTHRNMCRIEWAREREHCIQSSWVLNNNKATFKFYSILDCHTISHTHIYNIHVLRVVVTVNQHDGCSLLFPFNEIVFTLSYIVFPPFCVGSFFVLPLSFFLSIYLHIQIGCLAIFINDKPFPTSPQLKMPPDLPWKYMYTLIHTHTNSRTRDL